MGSVVDGYHPSIAGAARGSTYPPVCDEDARREQILSYELKQQYSIGATQAGH